MLRLLFWRKARSAINTLTHLTFYEAMRNGAFALAGLALLAGMYLIFHRLLAFLATVPLIGHLLLWKLTAMVMLTTFVMVAISSLLTSLSTLFGAFDLKFLMNAPLSQRNIFLDKALESLFLASWMVALVQIPYVLALVRVNHYGAGFFFAFLILMVPFLALAASVGTALTLILLYHFPSSRTRDAIWILVSFFLTALYVLFRFAEPERLLRPDALRLVSDYLDYLQSPTARDLPSWWLTAAVQAWVAGKSAVLAKYAGLLFGSAAAVYAGLTAFAGKAYFTAYSGSQEGRQRRRPVVVAVLPEGRLPGLRRPLAALLWKERKTFLRDVQHWSQIMLVSAMILVYLFSIKRLPLDNTDLRSLISFLNVAAAGFVMAALGLRFTYPAISLEGRSWWVVRSAPVTVGAVMRQKFLFSIVPMLAIALTLSLVTNHFLEADAFTSWVSSAALLAIAWSLTSMGIGFGALFPMFAIENIHQIESSLGGFVYMASSMAYIGATIGILSWPMRMHFWERLGHRGDWDWRIVACCAAGFAALNAAAISIPWTMGKRALERHEL